ncbi:MAG: hypothetical protein WKF67_00995, partial [Rubrobacteraceae bacterium]
PAVEPVTKARFPPSRKSITILPFNLNEHPRFLQGPPGQRHRAMIQHGRTPAGKIAPVVRRRTYPGRGSGEATMRPRSYLRR